MFNITLVVFSLVIGALAHKLYLEYKMAKKRSNRIQTFIGKGSKSKKYRNNRLAMKEGMLMGLLLGGTG